MWDIADFDAALQAVATHKQNTRTPEMSKRRAVKRSSLEGGTNIGGLSENTLHLTLKYFAEPDNSCHEVFYNGFHIDVMRDDFVYEIQTKNFGALRKKLQVLLLSKDVTVVLPIVESRRLVTVDPKTGEVLRVRRSPKKETDLKLLRELIHIPTLIDKENLHVCVCFVACDDIRLSSPSVKAGVKYDVIPTALTRVWQLDTVYPYLCRYVPPFEKGRHFTGQSMSEYARLSKDDARIALKLLEHLGYLKKDGKDGRFHRYAAIKSFGT